MLPCQSPNSVRRQWLSHHLSEEYWKVFLKLCPCWESNMQQLLRLFQKLQFLRYLWEATTVLIFSTSPLLLQVCQACNLWLAYYPSRQSLAPRLLLLCFVQVEYVDLQIPQS